MRGRDCPEIEGLSLWGGGPGLLAAQGRPEWGRTPLVAELVGSGTGPQAMSLWWARALGAGLGGNATAIGASANVGVTGIAAREGHPISFGTFTRYGIVVTTVTVLIAWPYLWLRYFVLA